jgi:hypothetical protein
MIVPVEGPFRPHIATAVTRLRYLFPALRFEASVDWIIVTGKVGVDANALAREIQYALYREKIYSETLPMRHALIEAVTRR